MWDWGDGSVCKELAMKTRETEFISSQWHKPETPVLWGRCEDRQTPGAQDSSTLGDVTNSMFSERPYLKE